jgi:hypothetical protein
MRTVPDPPVTRAAKAELVRLGFDLASSTLAAAVLDLARRLDAEPTDRDAVDLARELRMALAELRRQADASKPEGGGIVDRIRTAALGN